MNESLRTRRSRESTHADYLEAMWQQRLQELIAWRAEHEGRWPRSRMQDQSAAKTPEGLLEKRLGTWLDNNRRRGVTSERRFALDRACPGWEELRKQQAPPRAWSEMLEDMRRWRAAQDDPDSWPSMRSSDAHERRLALWLENTRRRVPEGSARAQLLDETVPGWRAPAQPTWDERLAAAVAWNQTHAGFPSSKSEDADERSLGNWLIDQRRPSVSAARQAVLDAQLPGWRNVHEHQWHTQFTRLERWLSQHGTHVPPRLHGADDEETQLAEWLEVQRARASAERASLLDQLLPGWRDPMELRWRARLAELQTWREEHSDRWPSAYSKDPYEMSLGRWVAFQRHLVRDGRLPVSRQRALDESASGWLGELTH